MHRVHYFGEKIASPIRDRSSRSARESLSATQVGRGPPRNQNQTNRKSRNKKQAQRPFGRVIPCDSEAKDNFSMKRKRLGPIAKTLCFGGVLLGGASAAMAEDSAAMDKLVKENQDMKTRLETLEALAQKEGLLPSGAKPPQFVHAMSDITLSGFVQASYFYNTREPADGKSDAYLWNASHNSFSINKVKVTLASKAVEKDKWDAGFRTSLIWGEDSPNLNTGSPGAGFEALREAYVELNVPLGTGLDIKAGQLISLLNWESGDGG